MSTSPDPRIAIMDGESALPRKNGELVFQAPWEGRAFGLAVAMNDRGLYEWNAFRDNLVARIAHGDAASDSTTYYERWLAALEALLLERGFVTRAELDVRTAEYASGERDDDHDHDHYHDTSTSRPT
jgi:nitrile hydratase accessory protein